MVAAAIGAGHRLAALLIGGAALIATTLLVATGRDLSDLPTWAWLAIGGLDLLGAAVLIERASKHGAQGLQEPADRWR
jgi:heme A synthase